MRHKAGELKVIQQYWVPYSISKCINIINNKQWRRKWLVLFCAIRRNFQEDKNIFWLTDELILMSDFMLSLWTGNQEFLVLTIFFLFYTMQCGFGSFNCKTVKKLKVNVTWTDFFSQFSKYKQRDLKWAHKKFMGDFTCQICKIWISIIYICTKILIVFIIFSRTINEKHSLLYSTT